jgi:hypothetical protein
MAQAHEAFAETKQHLALSLENRRNWTESSGFYLHLLSILSREMLGGSLPQLFLSHSRDGLGVTKRLARMINESKGNLDAWFDKSNMVGGENIRDRLKQELPTSFFIAVVTDGYIRSRWTRWEAIEARRHDRPVLIVDALSGSARRLTPELANAPLVRWPLTKGVDRGHFIPSLILVELLRRELHRQQIRISDRETRTKGRQYPTIVPTVLPFLSADAPSESRRQVYADPPLAPEELEVDQAAGGLRPLSSTQFFVERGCLPTGSTTPPEIAAIRVGMSVSLPSDGPAFGLYEEQVNDLSVMLAAALVHMGADLAYGGDLRPGGITFQLAHVVDQFAPAKSVKQVLRSFIAWPLYLQWTAEGRRQRLVNTQPTKVEPGPLPPRISPKKKSLRKYEGFRTFVSTREGAVAFARSLARLRREMTGECQARVALGGASAGALGRMPGVLEEVMLALRENQPVYLLAGFGGATEVIYRAMRGGRVPEFTEQHQQNAKYGCTELLKDLQGTDDAVNWDSTRQELKDVGLEGLAARNGLTVEDNERLAKTRIPAEVMFLLAKGLSSKFGRRPKGN